MRTLIIRAELGKVVSSSIVDEDLYAVVKKHVMKASEEWDPARSDLLVMKDLVEIELNGVELPEGVQAEVVRTESGRALRLLVYLISFDNEAKSDEVFEERKVYLIAPYAGEDIREMLESYAEDLTSSSDVEGIKEI